MSNPRLVSRLAAASIAVSIAVMGIKFVAWELSGSVALYSDALESIVNVIAALIAWFAIRMSQKPADDTHQFGHHKAEYFSAVFEGVLIVLAALLIFHEAWMALGREHALANPGPGMLVNALAASINAVWAFILIRVGRREKSPALTADGRHIYADVITSVGVLFGLLVTLATGWIVLDALMAFLVGANVLWEGWRVISSSINGLMDVSVDSNETALIEKIILANATGALEAHDIRTRMAGPVTFIEFHLVVEGSMSVSRSHQICDHIEAELRKAIPNARTIIHVEPDHKLKDEGIAIS